MKEEPTQKGTPPQCLYSQLYYSFGKVVTQGTIAMIDQNYPLLTQSQRKLNETTCLLAKLSKNYDENYQNAQEQSIQVTSFFFTELLRKNRRAL
jgi:hypothetical protein